MEGRIKGSWPGGPRREGDTHSRAHTPHLQRVQEIEARIASRSFRVTRQARTRRAILGMVFSAGLALALGWVVGVRSHATAEELTVAQEARRATDVDISSEINRALLELWKMEDVEYQRNRR